MKIINDLIKVCKGIIMKHTESITQIFITILLLTCSVSRDTIKYELPPKQAGDDPAKLQTILAFKTKDAEKLFDKDDTLLEGKYDEFKKIAGKESSNPIVLRLLARFEGKITNLDKAKSTYEKSGLTNNSHYAWVLHDYGDYYKGKEDYLKAEEFYDKSIEIFEKLGDKENLVHLFKDAGVNLVRNANSCASDNKSKNPRKARDYFLKSKALQGKNKNDSKKGTIQIQELTIDENRMNFTNYDLEKFDQNHYEQIFADLWVGETYRIQWLNETGEPIDVKKKNANGIEITEYLFTNYYDYEKAKSIVEAVYAISKSKGYSTLLTDSAAILAQLNFYEFGFYGSHDCRTRYSDFIRDAEIDKKHSNAEKAYKYALEVSEGVAFDYKVAWLANAINIYDGNEDTEEYKNIQEKLKYEIDSNLEQGQIHLFNAYKFKSYYGRFLERNGNEKETLDYYEKIINDSRFSKNFLKDYYKKYEYKFYNSDDPRKRLVYYFTNQKKYCEAAKWEKENIEYSKLFSKEKPDTTDLDEYTKKCNQEAGRK